MLFEYRLLDDATLRLDMDKKEQSGKEDLSLNMDKLKKLAHAGDADAQARLGKNYLYGIQTAKDKSAGEKWLLAASKQKDIAAGKWAEGICHENGIGTPKNSKAAFICYQEAAKKNYSPADCALGTYYKYGTTGVPKDEKLAVSLYQKSAEQGYTSALNYLADCYQTSCGVSKDEKEAFKLYTIAANQGNAYAQAKLAGAYLYCRCGITLKNETLGIKYASMAAEQGYEYGQYLLANCYWNRGEKSLAVKFYKLSAEQGNSNAAKELGDCYRWGDRGIPQDLTQARYWYKLAADKGNKAAETAYSEICGCCCNIL